MTRRTVVPGSSRLTAVLFHLVRCCYIDEGGTGRYNMLSLSKGYHAWSRYVVFLEMLHSTTKARPRQRPQLARGRCLCSFLLLRNGCVALYGILIRRYTRHLSAIGTGMVFIVVPTVISEHFVKNKGLAMGLNYAGVTVGLFVFPKLLEHLTATYGLRGALLIFNAYCMSYDCYMSLFVDFACDRGVAVSTAVSVLSAGAFSEGLGRFTLPFAVDQGLFTNNVALTITLAAEAVAFPLLPFLRTHELIFAMAIGINFITGTAMVLFPVTLESYFGHEKMSVAFGIVVASAGLQSFVRASLIGMAFIFQFHHENP
ncbi:hypothetical protein MTO96_040889 [Rhipicephalus appendiculatus]